MKTLTACVALMISMSAIAEQKVIRLYSGSAPGSETWTHKEKENNSNMWRTRVVFNVVDPTLTAYLPNPADAVGTAVIICPGGAFYALSIDSEGIDVAKWLNTKGIAAFVLKYRLVECHTDDPTTELMNKGQNLEAAVKPIVPLAMADALAAIAHVRQHAKEYNVQPDRIGITGFSAGGTVACSAAYNYSEASRPNFAAPIYLAYEWVPHTKVPADAPPMFILAASDDPLGLAPHSVALYKDWTEAKKSAELHLYSKGGHGFGMRKQNLPSDQWIQLFADWLGAQGLLKRP